MNVVRFGKASIVSAVIGIAATIAGYAFDPSYTLAGLGILITAASVGMGLTGYCHYRSSVEADPWVSGIYIAAAFVVNISIMFLMAYLVAAGYEMTYY